MEISKKLTSEFYNRNGLEVAKSLLGNVMVKITDGGEVLRGRIVETEAYLGQEDKCCHSYQKSPTAKTRAMFMRPGTAYVYNVYFKYCCYNISCQGEGAVVLIRALEPLAGLETMQTNRQRNLKKPKVLLTHELANGPSKLCMALGITKEGCNELDLTDNDDMWLEECGQVLPEKQINTTRVGLGKKLAEDYRVKPWRFYLKESLSVSVRDKIAEASFTLQ